MAASAAGRCVQKARATESPAHPAGNRQDEVPLLRELDLVEVAPAGERTHGFARRTGEIVFPLRDLQRDNWKDRGRGTTIEVSPANIPPSAAYRWQPSVPTESTTGLGEIKITVTDHILDVAFQVIQFRPEVNLRRNLDLLPHRPPARSRLGDRDLTRDEQRLPRPTLVRGLCIRHECLVKLDRRNLHGRCIIAGAAARWHQGGKENCRNG